MFPPDLPPDRLQWLNKQGPARGGRYVLYWMQQSQRAHFNHTLEYAIERANAADLPLVVGFGLTSGYPDANLRHYSFMLEGLAETARTLRGRGLKFVLQLGDPAQVALRLGKRAAVIVCDRGYLCVQKKWRETVAARARCEVVQVESDVIVPVAVASTKREFGARTIRPRLLKAREKYLVRLKPRRLRHASVHLRIHSEDPRRIDAICRRLKLNRSVAPVSHLYRGGNSEAQRRFKRFLASSFRSYKDHRNQPQTNDVSHMSKYLHFGQVSPVWLALEAEKCRNAAGRANVYTFIDELLVRRELAINWVEFTPNYDSFDALPAWARTTLAQHVCDKRPHLYSQRKLEEARTHDPYWNAAMLEMRESGYMHNHMRMYWGKKILEWSRTPQQAYAVALSLNNKFFLDGRDPNGFANVGWVFGLHDRPWPERNIFGKVRYMNAAGLERKCDIAAYVDKVNRLAAREKRTIVGTREDERPAEKRPPRGVFY